MKKIIITLLVTMCLFLVFNFLFGRSMILESTGDVVLVKNIKDIFKPTSNNIVGVVKRGQRAKITSCSNLVDDQVYKVELESGEQGYATGTKFKIISEPSRNLVSIGVICW